MKPSEFGHRLAAYLDGPDPEDPDAPLSAEERELVEAQGVQLLLAEDS